jgi:hypothetical protein
MGNERKVLVLVGSPKGKLSASNTLGTFLTEKLGEKFIQAQLQYLTLARNSGESFERLMVAMGEADVLVLVFPLYADQLPSGVVETLERYSAFREGHRLPKDQSLMALVNCGFPEAAQNDAALSVVKRFAELHHLQWLGGLSLGGGGIVDSEKPLQSQGGKVRRIMHVLEMAATAISKGLMLPEEAKRDIRRQVLPSWLYRLVGNWGFRKAAKEFGISRQQVCAKPFINQLS